jgi:hypothetical protein
VIARAAGRQAASLAAAAGAALVVGALAPTPWAAVPVLGARRSDAVLALPQVRDTGRGPAVVETASVSGTLVTDEATPHPVRRATMTLGGVPGYGRVTVTDNDGHFAFVGLPAGRFTLTAARPGYVTVSYGARRPGRPGVPIAVGDGQRVDITMTIVRGAVITGTIVDPHGRAMPNVRVEALLATTGGGSAGSSNTGVSTTDDRGIYRIYGLAPGTYHVRATTQTPFLMMQQQDGVHQVTSAEVQWAQQQVTGHAPTASPAPPFGRAMSYAPVYFPGTADAGAAAVVTPNAGEEATASFALLYIPAVSVAGTVVGPNGPLGRDMRAVVAMVRIAADGAPPEQGPNVFGSGPVQRPVGPDGSFSFSGLGPGAYELVARTAAVMIAPRAGGAAPPSAEPPTPLWGDLPVTVTGEDQTSLVLQLQPGIRFSGSTAFEGTHAAPPNGGGVTVSLVPVAQVPMTPIFQLTARTHPDSSFVIPGVPAGRYTLKVVVGPGGATPAAALAGLAGGRGGAGPDAIQSSVDTGPSVSWQPKSAMLNGHDLLDVPFDIAGDADVAGLAITFTDRTTDLTGTVLDAQGHPSFAVAIVAFSTNRALWTDGSRRTKSSQPATNGVFDIPALPPGEYYVAAVPDFDPSELGDPSFLAEISALAMKVSLADGEQRRLDLKMAGGSLR